MVSKYKHSLVLRTRVLSIQYIVGFVFSLYFILCSLYSPNLIHAYDPLSVSNNRFGVHIISATPEEADQASAMVNTSGGDWGYVTVVVSDSDRDHDKWQKFFDELRVKHLIPIVRIATAPQGDFWKVPYDKEEDAWADFLNNLNWPTKNRYVIIYNEPNHAQEWGNQVDAASFARVLNKTIDALKSKNPDFFVLNPGFDASAPQKLPAYEDEENFLKEMNAAVPGIFNKLDGWDSHSYPNPGFSGPPDGDGRGSVRTYQWELSVLKNLGVTKDLPVFITETGWKHAEGQTPDNSLPSSIQVGDDFREAFQNAWNDPEIAAVTPFLMDYQTPPFDHFSFKKLDSEISNLKILGAKSPDRSDSSSADYYPQYLAFTGLSKNSGNPLQDNVGVLISGSIYSSMVAGQEYQIPLIIKNTGESVWGEKGPVTLVATVGRNDLNIGVDPLPPGTKIFPGQTAAFQVRLKAPDGGKYQVNLNLINGSEKVNVSGLEFMTEVKSPVVLVVKSNLKWKNDSSGNYFLSVISSISETTKQIILGKDGTSPQIEERDILPDYEFDFTLKKDFYQPKTIHLKVHSGVNTLDFGQLQPDIGSAILNLKALWGLLPFSQ